MPLVSKSIPNLINGVSQQADSLRLPTQAERQENLYSSVVEGLKDRPPLEHIGKLYNGTVGPAFAHLINRDPSERYVLLIRDGDLTVHDIEGTAKTVTFPDGKAYLEFPDATPVSSGSNTRRSLMAFGLSWDASLPEADGAVGADDRAQFLALFTREGAAAAEVPIKAITVADYTFILNTKTPALQGVATTAVRPKEALIFVKAGNYGSDYKVFIDGTQQAIKTTSTTVVTDIATNAIATDLAADLVANLGAGWTVTRYGSVISLVKATGDFKIKSEDSQGGSSLQVFKDNTQNFSSLPTIAPTDFQIAITGNPESGADEYYLKFVPATSGEAFGEGSWEETVAQGITHTLDASTMPHVLIRNGDGTFTFKRATWDNLTVGDLTTAKPPSFVGSTINDVYFFKNRLCFLTGEGGVKSEVGQYFNFWPTTVTTEVDSDRIDFRVSHTKVSILNHAVPFDEKVILFSALTQFVCQGGQTLTAKTIQVDPTTEYENSLVAKPVESGDKVYFVTPNGQFAGMREYFVDQTTAVKKATNITAHVPKYLPTGVFKLAASTTDDVVLALTSGDPTAFYLYKFFLVGEEKLQSSWSRCTIGSSGTILDAGFIESVLYLTIQRSDGVYFEKMNFSAGATDPDVNFVTHYDRRITEAKCAVSYNGGTNETTWILPYSIDGTMKAVTRGATPGQLIPLTYQSGDTLKASGDHTGKALYIGQTYLRRYRFSKFYVREENKEGKAIVLEGRLQLRTGTLAYAETGTFTVTVTQDYRNPSSYVEYRDPTDAVFTGRILGAGSNLLGAVALATGSFRFPILSKNDQVTIEITTDSFLPMRLLSLDWEGFFHARSQRM